MIELSNFFKGVAEYRDNPPMETPLHELLLRRSEPLKTVLEALQEKAQPDENGNVFMFIPSDEKHRVENFKNIGYMAGFTTVSNINSYEENEDEPEFTNTDPMLFIQFNEEGSVDITWYRGQEDIRYDLLNDEEKQRNITYTSDDVAIQVFLGDLQKLWAKKCNLIPSMQL